MCQLQTTADVWLLCFICLFGLGFFEINAPICRTWNAAVRLWRSDISADWRCAAPAEPGHDNNSRLSSDA
jgi:hypothetical protein